MALWTYEKYSGYVSCTFLGLSEKKIEKNNFLKSLFKKKLSKYSGSRKVYSYYIKEINVKDIPKEVFKWGFKGYLICKDCGKKFPFFEKKTLNICGECRNTPHPCECGCGGIVIGKSKYLQGHFSKGKTYKEIYGTNKPKCGFRSGEENVAKKSEIRKKISNSIKQSYKINPSLITLRKLVFDKYRNVKYSKISQDLFWEIFQQLEDKDHLYFAELNKEFQKTDNVNHKGFYFDFVDTKRKKIIEFNGNKFHANPKLFSENEKPNPYIPLTSKEIWNQDKIKLDFIRSLGFDVLVVWEDDYRKDKQEIIKKCLIFLDNYIIK